MLVETNKSLPVHPLVCDSVCSSKNMGNQSLKASSGKQAAGNQQILKQAAEDLIAKKDEFMSIASHKLKTPITIVKASLQFLQRITDKNDTLQNIAPFIDKAPRQVNKLTEIVNDLPDGQGSTFWFTL